MIKQLLCEDKKCISGGFHLSTSNELMVSEEEKLYLYRNQRAVQMLILQGHAELEANMKVLSDRGFSYDSPR